VAAYAALNSGGQARTTRRIESVEIGEICGFTSVAARLRSADEREQGDDGGRAVFEDD
jgi:hypothetical protein